MRTLMIGLALISVIGVGAQDVMIDRSHEPSAEHPYGTVHPDYIDQLSDFAPLIGACNCKSVNRAQDGTWNDTLDMVWEFKYIMNGTSIQDETWKEDGGHSGSIRQYIADSSSWAVTYFSSKFPTPVPGVWMGGAVEDDVVLYMDQAAPNGTPGDSKLTFYNIDDTGFDWKGEWVSKGETFTYPFWMISCERVE